MQIKIDDVMLEVKVKCEQEGSPNVISNCIDVIISIAPKSDDVTVLREKGLKVCISSNSSCKVVGVYIPNFFFFFFFL